MLRQGLFACYNPSTVTADSSKTVNRDAQKVLFAQQYFVNPHDRVMIAARVLGDEAIENPMLAINFGNTWCFDPIVIDELTKLKHATNPKGLYEATALDQAMKCFARGDSQNGEKLLKLAATIAGHMPTGKAAGTDSSNGAGHVQELLDAIADPNNRREDAPQVAAVWR